MAKARPVPGLSPEMPLRMGAGWIIRTRLEELWAWEPYLADAEAVIQLHDMRIAGKRLRYCLEFFAPCFDPVQHSAALAPLKKLQDYLGDIHDCDVWMVQLRAELKTGLAEFKPLARRLEGFHGATAELQARADALSLALAEGPAAQLLAIVHDLAVRRQALFLELQGYWAELAVGGYRRQLEAAAASAASLGPAIP